MKWTILRKGGLIVSLPLVSNLVFIVALARMQEEEVAAHRRVTYTRDVILQANALLAALVDAETGLRGYVLTSNRTFAEPYEAAVRSVPDALAGLETLVAGNAEQAAAARRIADKVGESLAWMAGTESLVRENIDDVVRHRMATGEGKKIMDEVRGLVRDFLAAEDRLEAERTHQLNVQRRRQAWLMWVAVAGALGTAAALAVYFSHNISGRLGVVAANTHRLILGQDLTPPVSGSDEIAQLDRDFRTMAAALARARAQERAFAAELEVRVADRTAELVDANHQLRQKNQENETFVYSVSHDLRSPLVNLQGFSKELGQVSGDLLQLLTDERVPAEVGDKARKLLTGDMAESIHYIQTAVTRLSKIIDALLHLSRVGRVQYQPQRVDLKPVLERIVSALHGTIVQRGATVTVGDLPPAWGDPTALEQLFANLIGNALNYLDAARPGLVEIGCAGGPEKLGENKTVDHAVTYYVRDNGLGIPESFRPKMFQAFQRCHTAVPGEGIGLAIVHRIAERHGAKVRLESAVGTGTTFFISLPLSPPTPARRGSALGSPDRTEERP